MVLQPKGLHLHTKSVSPPLRSAPLPLVHRKLAFPQTCIIFWRSKAILINSEFLVNVAWSFKAVTVMITIVLRNSLCTDLMFLQCILSWFHYIIFIAHATEKTVFTLLNWVDINWDRRSLKQWQPLLSGFQIEWPVCDAVDSCTVCSFLSMKFVPRLVCNWAGNNNSCSLFVKLRINFTCVFKL